MKPVSYSIAIRKPVGKWASWAERLQSRFSRRSDAWRLGLTLHAHIARTSMLVEQRWLHPTLIFRPKLHLAVLESLASNGNQVFRQTALLRELRTVFASRPQLHPPADASLRQIVWPRAEANSSMMLHTSRVYSREELAGILERRFATRIARRETQHLDVSTRLTHRLQRVEEANLLRQMTLKREVAASTVKSAAGVRTFAPSEEQRRPFPSGAPAQPVMPAINVDQLAEQVIRQIDRRVVARRERMGKI